MKILPFDTFVIHTEKSVSEIKELLANHVDEKRILNVLRSSKKFEGKISDEGFKISRIISYRNSFLPILHGSYDESAGGTNIIINLRLHQFVIAFMIVWFVFFGLGMIFSLANGKGGFFEVIFLVVFAAIIPIFFHWEAKKAKDLFGEIFNNKLIV